MARTFLANAGALGASRLFLSLSQVLVLPVIARFLGPSEFGDMALAMTVVIFAQLLSDAGMGRSLIRQPTYDAAEWNSVFWLLAGVGLALTLAILALAPVWADFYDRPQLVALLWALSVVPMLNAVSAVSIARMEKDGLFPQIALMRTVAGAAGLVAVIGLIFAGTGVWALVGQQIVLAAVQMVWAVARSRFRPAAPRRFTPLRGHVRFAGDTVGVSLIYTVQRQAPVMLIGAVLGAAPVGLFVMANRFLNLPRFAVTGPVAQVVYVQMAKVQDNGRRIAEIYTATCLLLSVAIFPPMAILAAGAGPILELLLSETWAPAAVVFTLAAVGVMVELATSSLGVLLQALDRTRLRLRMVIERTVLRTLAIAAALPFGLEAVALAISVFTVAYTPRYLAFAQRVAPVSQRAVYRAMAPAAAASALAAAGIAAFGGSLGGWHMLGLACAALPVTLACAIVPQIGRIRRALSLLNG